jgi:AcrR family transcriptional regulator
MSSTSPLFGPPPAPPLSDSAGPRERLLATAERLIYSGGIHATGIDAIVRDSGAARKSVYGYFASKNELVAAALAQRDARWMQWFEAGVDAAGTGARMRLLAMFDLLRAWFAADGFHGCAFLNAAGEIGDPSDPIRRIAEQHKMRLFSYIEQICLAYCREAGGTTSADSATARTLAHRWLLLIDGAIGIALVSGRVEAADDARAIAVTLLDTHASPPQESR